MTLQLSRDATEQDLPIFKVFADQGKHPAVAMDRPVCVVGRQYGVNLPLNAPQVSNYHALIVRDGDRIYLRDLASTNGVERNGEPVAEAALHDADSLRIGAFTLRCASGFDGNGRLDHDAPAAGDDELRVNDEPVPFPPGRRTLLIGRRARCDLQPGGEDVAKVHAVIFVMDGKRYVRDLNTPGGTYVNGEPVHQAELRAGDVLRVGAMTMEYVKAPATLDVDVEDDDAPARLGESRIPLVDESLDESERSDAPLIAVAGAPEPTPPTDQPGGDAPSIESRADALLGGSSIVGEIFESHYDAPAPVTPPEPAEHAPPELAPVDAARVEPAETGSASVERAAAVAAPDARAPAPAPQPAPEPEPLEIVELPGVYAATSGMTSGDEQSNGTSPTSQNGEGPAIELVPAAGVAEPEDASGASDDAAGERYVVPVSALTLTSLPADDDAGQPPDDPRAHRDPRADAAGDTIAGEEVITTLVDELANRATTLKHAWEEHRTKSEQ